MKYFVALTLILFSEQVLAGNTDSLKKLPIQAGGRSKPFDSFAREALRIVYGKSTYKKKEASEVVFTWSVLPGHWNDVEIVEISRTDLKKNLKLDEAQKYFSPKAILSSPRLSLVMQELESSQAEGKKLDPYFQAVQRLKGQLDTYQAVATGVSLSLVPPQSGDRWITVREFDEVWAGRYSAIVQGFADAVKEGGDGAKLDEAVNAFIAAARAENPNIYPTDLVVAAELHYSAFHPFRWSWVLYLLAAILFLISGFGLKGWTGKWGWAFVISGFILNSYGFGLRIYLTGRPPVSNMYESVIWVAWGVILFAMIFEYLKRREIFILSASIAAALCLIVADVSPTVLDPTLQPLQPVLRSNLWLIVHVMTITLGYSAFALSFVIGNIGLYYYLKNEKGNLKRIGDLTEATYRAVQVGVVLLAAGTILGGVWADYSWGRFWGWDPKETWAFIALVGYLAVLHGRLSGWLRNFGFLVTTVISFSLVVMAWYGVNFVLGAGLHSYGFGGGGVEYVAGAIALEFVFVALVITVRQSRLKKKK